MPEPLYIRAEAVPSNLVIRDDEAGAVKIEAAAEGDDKKLRKFTMTAYTGGRMNVGFGLPVVVDLSGMRVPAKSRPILLDHNPGRIIGHTDSVTINAGSIAATGVISGTGAAAVEVAGSSDNGFPWQASIGAAVEQMVRVDAGETVEVNGRKFAGPVYVARKSRLMEISFVALGADDNTQAKVAASAAGPHLEVLAMNFEAWLKANGHDPATLTDEQRATLKAKFDAEQQKPATKGADTPEKPITAGEDGKAWLRDQIDALKAERVKLAKVEAAAKGHPEILEKAISAGWDEERTKMEVELANLRAGRPKVPGVIVAGSQSDPRVIEAALCLSAGLPAKVVGEGLSESDREKVMNAASASNMRGFSLHAAMDVVIHAAGEHYNGSRKSNDYIRAALNADRTLRASSGAGFTTLSLSGILGNVANKALIASFTAVEVVWNQIAAVRSHGDFKTHTRYRLDSSGAFKKVGKDGELKQIGLSEASYTNTVGTYGAIVALTRQDMINDDLGAFLQLPAMLGRMAALRIEEAVFALLLSNPSSFFASGNGNYFEGASTALSIDSLSTGKQKFRNMVDSNGKPILVSPSRILVPTTLEQTADVLLTEQRVIDGSSTKQPARNPHVGTLSKIVSPYLNNTSIRDQDGAALTGQSDTAWYLFADPNVRAAIAVAFLNGQSTPTIESADTDFATLGMQWRAFQDFGVGMEETYGAVKSKGAA